MLGKLFQNNSIYESVLLNELFVLITSVVHFCYNFKEQGAPIHGKQYK